MFHISKQNVAIRMQVKHLLNINNLEIIWSSFSLIIMNKFLRKPVLVRKSLIFSSTGFLFFLSLLHRKPAIQICFCKASGENGMKLLPEPFLSYQKEISFVDVFITFQLLRSVRLRRKWFLGENKERKTTLLQGTQEDQISFKMLSYSIVFSI